MIENKSAFYNKAEVIGIRSIIIGAGLEAPADMLAASDEELAAVWNGIGPDDMPMFMRNLLTKRLLPFLQGTAAIHDWNYEHSDGTEAGQKKADRLFMLNGLDEIPYTFSWYSWRRYVGVLELITAYYTLRTFGGMAWLITWARRKFQKEQPQTHLENNKIDKD